MRKTLFLFVLLALVAPFAAADGIPASDTHPVTADEAPAEAPELDADAFIAELNGAMEAEEKYVCPIDSPGDCGRAFDCEITYGACTVGNGWQCLGSDGSACSGTCYCC